MAEQRPADFLDFEIGSPADGPLQKPRSVMPWEDEPDPAPRPLPSGALGLRPLEPGSSHVATPAGTNLPRRRRLVGRDVEAREVEEALAGRGGLATLYGMAGMGKTALALEVAHRASDRRAYAGGVWWLSAEGAPAEALARLLPILRAAAPAPVRATLAALAAGASPAEVAAVVRLALQMHRAPTLLILDGVDASGWRAQLPGGEVRVLATARDERLSLGVPVRMIALSPEHARDLAAAIAGRPDGEAEAKALDHVASGGLGGHPAAVEAAASAVARWAQSWVEYERHMYSAPRALLEERDPQGDYPESALGALDRSIDGCARGTWARRLLEGAAVFAPDEVPIAWAASAAEGDSMSLETARALALLSGLGLVHRDHEARTVSVHRLVHHRVRERAEPDDFVDLSRRGALCVAGWLEETVDPTRTLEVESRRAHLEEGLSAADRAGANLVWLTIAERLSAHLRHLALYPEARELLERAVGRAERLDPPNPPRLAESLAALASLLKDLGLAAVARPYLERALALDEQVHGPRHPAVARDLQSLASVLKDLGQTSEALPLLERALSIDEAVSGPDHPNTAKSLSTLATVLKDLGRASEARVHLERALAIEERAFGPDHPSSVVRLTNLAMVLKDLGHAAEARPLLQRALSILEGTYGPDHPIVATSLTNLALVLKDLGQTAEAMPLLQRANRIAERALPSSHPTRAKIAAHLAFAAG
jgi:tetratricopeptide (TPR) repeat protein